MSIKKLIDRLIHWLSPIKLVKEEEQMDTLKELARFRAVEDQMERITTLLKCPAEDVLAKLNKHLQNISRLEAEIKALKDKEQPPLQK